MAKDFDKLIKQKQEELEPFKSQMEELRQEFIRDSVNFVSEWYKKTAESHVERDADRTIKLGKEEIWQMKIEVLKLAEGAEAIVNDSLLDQKLWWHLTEDDDLSYSFYANKAPENLDIAIHFALGKLGIILEKFGYVRTESTGGREEDVWCEWDSSGNYHLPGGRPYYPYSINWSETMRDTITRYDNVHKQANSIVRKINSLRIEKKEHQAKDLWDSS